jgi:NADH-quinone oxidoreductase subunit G
MAEVKEREKTPLEKRDADKAVADQAAAQAAGVEMVSLTVDGVEVSVPKGTLIIEAAFRAGSDIPYFCYHPRLSSVGACRMCLAAVELEQFGQRRTMTLATCTVPVGAGMVVKTNTPDIKKAQNGVLEFLLTNHPLDCPICDRGGECPLQNMTITYGPPTSRYIEEKRHFPKAMPISDYVVLDRERCIQCMRCTRFADEIAGDGKLDLIGRGAETQVGPFMGQDFDSNFSGNTIEICPVGALTSRTYRFSGRPWEVKSADSICSKCGNGCNISVQHRLGKLVRVNARVNEAINEEWTCDKGKFGHGYVSDDNRLTDPLIRTNGVLSPATWEEAMAFLISKIKETIAEEGAESIAGIGSTRATLEDNYLFQKLLKTQIGTPHVAHQMRPYPLIPMQTTIAAVENFKMIISVGMNLEYDQPMLYLRAYKAKRRKGATWLTAKDVDDKTVAKALKDAGEDAVLLLPHTLSSSDYATAEELCKKTGASLNILLPDNNSWGAVKAGVMPDKGGLDTKGILDACVSGKIQLLYIMGSDPATKYKNPTLAVSALEKVPFLVVQELFLTETAKHADIVLPAASFAEKDGTFINIEGREQKIAPAISPVSNAKPDWQICADILARLGTIAPYFSARDVYREYHKQYDSQTGLMRQVG